MAVTEALTESERIEQLERQLVERDQELAAERAASAEKDRQLADKDRELAEVRAEIAELMKVVKRRAKKHAEEVSAERARRCNEVMEAVETHYPDRAVEALAARLFTPGGKARARRIADGVEDISNEDVTWLVRDFHNPQIRAEIVDPKLSEVDSMKEANRKPKQEVEPEPKEPDQPASPPSADQLKAEYDRGYDDGKRDGIEEARAAAPRREEFLMGLPSWTISQILTGEVDVQSARKSPTEPQARRLLAFLVMTHKWRFDPTDSMTLAGMDRCQTHLLSDLLDRLKGRLGAMFYSRVRHAAISKSWFKETGSQWVRTIEEVLVEWRTPWPALPPPI